MWEMKKETVPVVVGALASVRRDLRGTLTEFQELASATSKKSLLWEQQNFSIASTLWNLRSRFGLGAAQAKQASQE